MREEVEEVDPAVDGGPHDAAEVGPLKVGPHDLVQLAVAEHEGLDPEAAGPQHVDGLLVLFGEPQLVPVPPGERESWPFRTGLLRAFFHQRVISLCMFLCFKTFVAKGWPQFIISLLPLLVGDSLVKAENVDETRRMS